jgi:hypothetical protein
LKLAWLRKPKPTYFLSYVKYRPNTIIAILWKTGHAKGGSHIREGVYKNEVKKVNIIDVPKLV